MPNPNENNPIQKLWEYIPPYTTPNYPPHVEVITTTNTGDTPMTDFDIVAGLRSRSAWFKREDIAEVLENAANEIDRLNDKVSFVCGDLALQEIKRLRNERDEARRRICEMLHEEGYGRSPKEWAKRKGWDCFKENTNG